MNIINYIKKLIEKIIYINNNTVNKTVIRSVYTERVFNVTPTPGANWKNISADARLYGNTLHIHFQGTRKSSSGAGNITNEEICTIKVANIVPYIKNIYNSSTTGMGYGGVAAIYTNNLSFSGQDLIIKINLAATHAAISSTNSSFIMMVALKENAFL